MEAVYLWIGYFILLIPSFVYFYRFAHLVPRYQLADSIVMANGFSSVISLFLFAWMFPEFFSLTPLYPGPATLINSVLVIFYGAHLGKNLRPVTPVQAKN